MEYRISVIIPLYNEQSNVKKLAEELSELEKSVDYNIEIIFIDDGSTDKTVEYLKNEISAYDFNRIRIIQFRRNFGQTSAMAAGIQEAKGMYIVPIDGDLQNPPSEIPRLISKAGEGYDIVSGWRKKRKDRLFTRILPSRIANWIISIITGVKLHDYGCTLKAYRRDVIQSIKLYGEMHRFLPALCSWVGARITEVEVDHRPRDFGKSKYGLGRTFKVILDLITVRFLLSFHKGPIYIFGGVGLFAIISSFILELAAVYMKLFMQFNINRNPIALLGIMMFIVGVQFIALGLLAEMMVRIYYESQNKPIFNIKEITEYNREEEN